MEIIRTALGPQHEKIVLKIPTSDFAIQFEDELRKYRQKANLRGFRKGKAPGDYVKKLVGKALLAEVVEKNLEKGMQDFIKENNLHVLGQPLLVTEEQPINSIDPFQLTDQEYHFELGYAPKLDLKGLTKEDVYTMHLIEVTPQEVTEAIEKMQRNQGTLVESEEAIGAEDTLEIEAKELTDGEIKPAGHETYFVSSMKDLQEDLKQDLLGKISGYTFDADIFQLELNRTEDYVKKYLLNLDQNETKVITPLFRMKVVKIKSLKPAELTQDLFKKVLGENTVVNTMEEFEGEVKKMIAGATLKSSEALLFREFQDQLLEKNDLQLPEEFLKKWLATKENSEKTLQDFPTFQKNLHWTLVRDHIVKTKEVEVTEKDIRMNLLQQVFRYMGTNTPPDYLWRVVERLMEDQEQVSRAHDEVLTDKLFDAIKSEVTVAENYVSREKFDELMEEARRTVTPQINDMSQIEDVQVEVEESKED